MAPHSARSTARRGGGFIPQFYTGLRCGVGRGRGLTRDIGLGNLGIAAAVLPAGCGWAAAITTHLHFLIVERWSQIHSAPPASGETGKAKIHHNA